MDRGERRFRTDWVCRRRFRIHFDVCHRHIWFTYGRPEPPCYCRILHKFVKWGAVSCRCKKGRGKVSSGFCHDACHGGYHPCVRERIEGKRLCQRWMRGMEE